MVINIITYGLLEFVKGFRQELLFAGVLCVSSDIVEQQRNLGTVLHWGDEQISQLQTMAAFVLVAPLQRNVEENDVIAMIRHCFLLSGF